MLDSFGAFLLQMSWESGRLVFNGRGAGCRLGERAASRSDRPVPEVRFPNVSFEPVELQVGPWPSDRMSEGWSEGWSEARFNEEKSSLTSQRSNDVPLNHLPNGVCLFLLLFLKLWRMGLGLLYIYIYIFTSGGGAWPVRVDDSHVHALTSVNV